MYTELWTQKKKTAILKELLDKSICCDNSNETSANKSLF